MANHDRDEEAELSSVCADCGATIDLEDARTYAFGEQSSLCWSCAIRRGGSYSSDDEAWTTAPAISDLAGSEEVT